MLRHYLERRTEEHDGSEVLQENHREVAEKQLIPRIIKRNRQAILVDPHHFHYFQRKKQGRRCSCFKIETSPDALCQLCFGSGIVGGYEKFGTIGEWFDSTYPRIRAVNVRQNFEAQTRPVMFSLIEGAVLGYVEFDWEIRSSRRKLDLFQVMSRDVGECGQVKALIRSSREDRFVPMTNQSLGERLCEHQAVIRVELSRKDPSQNHPVLSHVYVRYLLIDDPRVRMDVPRRTESVTLAEYGVFDSFTTITGWITDEVRKIGTEDFFRRIDDGTFWKAIESQSNLPLNQVTSHDIVLRLCQEFESYRKFPI
jgi:hypothetical protein